MTIPVAVLLAFAAWTLLTLVTTHGIYRWMRVLTRRAELRDFAHYQVDGERGWYVRGMRAHANCVENLPVYGAIVVAMVAAGIEHPALDVLAVVVIVARVLHTSVHVLFEQTNVVVGCRSAFFNVQWLAMIAMIAVVVARAAA